MFVDKIGSPPFPRAFVSRPKLPCESYRRSVNYDGNVHTTRSKSKRVNSDYNLYEMPILMMPTS
jgi:hypothetical protein